MEELQLGKIKGKRLQQNKDEYIFNIIWKKEI